MKILSKYKDFYDYLVGIYGVDEKLVLDRTKFDKLEPVSKSFNFTKGNFYICNYNIEGLWIDGKFITGTDLEEYDEPDLKLNNYLEYKFGRSLDRNYYRIRNGKNVITVLKSARELELKYSPNIKYDCPILYSGESYFGNEPKYFRFPKLEGLNIQKHFTPEQIWILLSNWLSKEKPIVNNQTDKEKIVSHGFDLKTSFRKM